MTTPAFMDWPFFERRHRELYSSVTGWCHRHRAEQAASHGDTREAVDAHCIAVVRQLGAAGLLSWCVRAEHGGAAADFDVRSIALIRESLARVDGLADFAFAMQGLGSGALSLAGSAALQARYLPRVARGEALAAFALSEADAGSDVAGMQCAARREAEHYVLDGAKTWISNGGIADFYCVFARTSPAVVRADGTTAAGGISAFVVPADAPGLSIGARIDLIAPHPMGTLVFRECRIHSDNRLGAEGEGFKIAMRTLDVFRTSVAAAALGFAQRALDEAVCHVRSRRMFGRSLADFQMTQAALADMATDVDAARLLTYRAAWLRDSGARVTKEAAMAKMTATETAQRVIDRAVQLFGARGVVRGEMVERLYRDIRALRIYEGATEVQKLIIARELLAGAGAAMIDDTGPRILQPLEWPRPKGYSNGMAARGLQIFVAGQIGWNSEGRFPSLRLADQVRQALLNILAVLAEAGASPAHVVRLTWFVTSREEYYAQLADIGSAYREVMGRHYPAMSVVQVVALMERDARVEIEATAVLPDAV